MGEGMESLGASGNSQSAQYMNLASAPGMTGIPASNPSLVKFEQIQNSMPLNGNMLRQTASQLRSGKAVGARTKTVMMAGPSITGSTPDFDSNENHMDREMLDAGMTQDGILN